MFTALVKGSILSLAAAFLLTGCGSDDEEIANIIPAQYEITVSNLTNFQPFSPVGLVFHEKGQHVFSIGQSASIELEKMAEGGDNSGLLTLGKQSVSTQGPVLPGTSASLVITKSVGEFELSAFSMLVNTNDAFTALDSISLDGLKVGESRMYTTNAYDAGTEANTEAAGTMPGPADGGEGFNATRDDVDIVRMHSGVVTKDDGLASSVLSAEAKFDNPVMHLVIKRIK